MNDIVAHFTGHRVLDICGGIGRNGELLAEHFEKVDILDLEPSFGSTPPEKYGRLIEANLRDINEYIKETQYDCYFGSWTLCYIGLEDIE